MAFVGRLGEPRKGFALLAEAFGRAGAGPPRALRLLVVGGGDVAEARDLLPPEVARPGAVPRAGAATRTRPPALRTADVYVAPNTGGESFGIVLVEAMAAGATVLASDLPAFRRVLDDGAYGELFATGDVERPGRPAGRPARRPGPARRLDAAAARAVRRYDWSTVAGRILRVYETVVGARR